MVQRVVLWAAAAEEAGERDDLVDDRQVGVEVNVFLRQLGQLAVTAWQLALHPADRQMRMKAALLFGIAELCFQCVIDLGLQALQFIRAILDADPERPRLAEVWETRRRRGR